jgi:hypothetical protein
LRDARFFGFGASGRIIDAKTIMLLQHAALEIFR